MSEFANLRMKKNAEIAEALSNFNKKDLYSWKPNNLIRSNVKLTNSPSNSNINNLSSPLFPAPPPKLKSLDSNLVIKRTTSLKDLDQKKTNLETRAATGNVKLKKLDFFLDKQEKLEKQKFGNEFLTSFKNQNNADLERPYLNSARDGYIKKYNKNCDIDSVIESIMKKDPLTLTEIDLSQFNLTSIHNLTKFKNLKILDLSCNKLTKLENLNFEKLIELRLFANQIESIEGLDQLKDLQSLQLQSNKIKSLDSKSLNQMKKLEFLRLDQNCIDSIKISDLASCSNLIYLNVSYNNLESLGFVNCLPNLEELCASNLRVKSLNDLDTNRLKKLTEIDLSNNQLNDSSLSCFKNIKTLTSLKISNNGLNSISNISQISSLRLLDISQNRVNRLEDLKYLTELETLDASVNQIQSREQIESLEDLFELSELMIKDNPLEMTRDEIIACLPRLNYLDDIPTDCFSLETNSQTKTKLDMTLIELDLSKFKSEIESLNQSFLKQFEEIKHNLDNIKIEKTNNSESKTDDSEKRSLSACSKQSSRRKLMDALYYSKQLGDNVEPECKTM
ncbi:unnamed protein product [Brachionus calyciflorus]|uniref:Uncharacterized protein n=1 Tax=Brachionus calyciflorus TaxID=104777 RepID=A0A814E917_9BILA|nr:unnamed protein product [Brachionus calyciflorus]